MTQSDTNVVDSVDKNQIKKAVHALLQIDQKEHTNDLFSGTDARKINLQFTFAKIPNVKNKTLNISLPNSLYNDSIEVCLFVKDLDSKTRDYEATVEYFKTLLEENGIQFVSEIIPLKALKTEYKQFEAKKNLSNQFDVFLADYRIASLLPSQLGKQFFSKKKQPVRVKLEDHLPHENLTSIMKNAVGNTRCILSGRGSCSMVTCANTKMSEDEITENIAATMSQLAIRKLGGVENLKTFNVKTVDSLAIPVNVNLNAPMDIHLPSQRVEESDSDPDDVTTVTGGKVKVSKDGDLIFYKDGGAKANLTKHDEMDHFRGAGNTKLTRNRIMALRKSGKKTRGNKKTRGKTSKRANQSLNTVKNGKVDKAKKAKRPRKV